MLYHSVIGNTIEIDVDIVNSVGEPVTLTGSEFTFTASTHNGDFSIVKTEISGIEIDALITGRLRVTIDPADTSTLLVPRNLVWDIMMTDLNSDVRRVARGRIALSLPVSALVV
jgi:hypothetical protein